MTTRSEGWQDRHYVLLLEPAEAKAYGLDHYLPKHRIVGLLDWDDFIVEDAAGRRFTVPTVPLDPKHLKELLTPLSFGELAPDPKCAGKIRWHVTPIVLGGDPKAEDNVTWLALADHQAAVKFWNEKYQQLRRK